MTIKKWLLRYTEDLSVPMLKPPPPVCPGNSYLIQVCELKTRSRMSQLVSCFVNKKKTYQSCSEPPLKKENKKQLHGNKKIKPSESEKERTNQEGWHQTFLRISKIQPNCLRFYNQFNPRFAPRRSPAIPKAAPVRSTAPQLKSSTRECINLFFEEFRPGRWDTPRPG